MTSKISYFFNKRTDEHIIQLVIDQSDFMLIPTHLNRPGLDVADHLIYLSEIVVAINQTKEERDSIMADFITDPPIDPILDQDEPLPDEEDLEEEEDKNIDPDIPLDEIEPEAEEELEEEIEEEDPTILPFDEEEE